MHSVLLIGLTPPELQMGDGVQNQFPVSSSVFQLPAPFASSPLSRAIVSTDISMTAQK
jgi:hypothetical protein